MAQRKTNHPLAPAHPPATPRANPAKPQPPTIEDRLIAKAEIADQTDFSGKPSLGQLTREERRKALFGV